MNCPLSKRQHEIVVLAMRGLTYKQIALRLNVSVSVVRSHVANALKRTGLEGRGELFMLMVREGWVPEHGWRGYDGAEYATVSQRNLSDVSWKPSPAQRLYLGGFDMLLRRDLRGATIMRLSFLLMCWERGINAPAGYVGSGPAEAVERRDEMLTRIGRGLNRSLYDDLPMAA